MAWRRRAGANLAPSPSPHPPPRPRRSRMMPTPRPAGAARLRLLLLPLLVLLPALLLLLPLAAASSSMAEIAREKPFKVLGQWLDGCRESDVLRGAGAANIERAFKVVASSQQALKTMDGVGHGFYAYSRGRAQVGAWSRLEYSRATRREKEERLKAFRKAKLLEEAVYSAELAELTAEGVTAEESLAYVGELQAKHEVLLQDFDSVQRGRFRFLLLADHGSRRLTLSVGDAVGTWPEKLAVVRARPQAVALRSRGLVKRSMDVNPHLWAAAAAVVARVRPVLAQALKETHKGYTVHVVGFSLGGGVAALVGGVLDGAIVVAPAASSSAMKAGVDDDDDDDEEESDAGRPGGKAKAEAEEEGIDDGAAGRKPRKPGRGKGGGAGVGVRPPTAASVKALQAATGMARDNVTVFVFAPPPCISKGVRGLRSFTTSFIMGDDMVPRANAASLERLEQKLLDYVRTDGGAGGIYLDYAKSWAKGVLGATLQQVVTHQVSRRGGGEDEEEEEEDEASVTLPGRVYYIKPRKLHGGATIKEVLRGNLREDVLWRIHDIFVSKSMLKHHALDKYVRVLARVPLQ